MKTDNERHVRLFRNGRNQAIRIPKDMELPGDEVVLRRKGHRLVIEPISPSPLLSLLSQLQPIDDVFPDIDEQLPPADDIRL